jgi:hypothetical protein
MKTSTTLPGNAESESLRSGCCVHSFHQIPSTANTATSTERRGSATTTLPGPIALPQQESDSAFFKKQLLYGSMLCFQPAHHCTDFPLPNHFGGDVLRRVFLREPIDACTAATGYNCKDALELLNQAKLDEKSRRFRQARLE